MTAPPPLREDAAPTAEEPPLRKVERENDRDILILCALVLTAALLLQVTPANDGVTLFGLRLPELCTLKRIGGECPGCGLTRSFVLGVRLDPEAFRLHPAGPLLLATVALQLPYRGLRILRRRRRGPVADAAPSARWAWLRWGLLASIFLGWGLRLLLRFAG